MTIDGIDYSFSRYLASKRSVDDRALNAHVVQVFTSELADLQSRVPVSMLEIGAGTGAMLERLLRWDVLHNVEYTAIDLQPENVNEARRCLPEQAARQGWQPASASSAAIWLERATQQVQVNLEAAELFDFMRRADGRRTWDVLLAHAFLDLVDISAALPRLFRLSAPGGLFYFTLNFDGETILEPAIDRALDRQIIDLYHRTMDERVIDGCPSGDSQSGRHMFNHLHAAGATLVAAGASDWVVHPVQGAYPKDEAYFLSFIIDTLHSALLGHADLDAERFECWIDARRRQVERAELVYIAHQLDFFGRAPG